MSLMGQSVIKINVCHPCRKPFASQKSREALTIETDAKREDRGPKGRLESAAAKNKRLHDVRPRSATPYR